MWGRNQDIDSFKVSKTNFAIFLFVLLYLHFLSFLWCEFISKLGSSPSLFTFTEANDGCKRPQIKGDKIWMAMRIKERKDAEKKMKNVEKSDLRNKRKQHKDETKIYFFWNTEGWNNE